MFNLASSQTSFVAWDPEEQVAVASRHLHQPTLGLERVQNSLPEQIACAIDDHEPLPRSRSNRDVVARLDERAPGHINLHCSLPPDAAWEEIRTTVNQDGTPKSILIVLVHHDQKERRLLRTALEKHHRVMEAASGEEAFDLARSHPVELVLIEPELPAIDGLALIKRLRQDEATIQVPIVYIPGERDQNSGCEALTAGANDILWRPFTPEDPDDHVTTLLESLCWAYLTAKNSPLIGALGKLAPYEILLTKQGSYLPVCQILEDPGLRMDVSLRALKIALPALLRQRDELPTAERELFAELIKNAERELAKALVPYQKPLSRMYDDEL